MPPSPVAVVISKRSDMAKKPAAENNWKRIDIERADNGGATVTVFMDSPGGGNMPFGGEPEKHAFESAASASSFVQDLIDGPSADAGAGEMADVGAVADGDPNAGDVPMADAGAQ